MAFSGALSLYPLTVRHGKHAQDVDKERELRSISLSTAYNVRRRVNPDRESKAIITYLIARQTQQCYSKHGI